MQDLTKNLNTLKNRISEAIERLGITADEAEITTLEAETQSPDFWADQQTAAKTSQKLASVKRHVDSWRTLEAEVTEAAELATMGDTSLEPDLLETFQRTSADFEQRQFELKLSGPYDKSDCVVSIFAGTGGTDAQDWAEMLLRMYLRYAEKQGYNIEIDARSDGEEAGIKSVTFEVSGPYAFGRLKSEKGVHRLVRLSPFNSDNLRQTSFALVDIVPLLATPEEVEIDPKELKIDVYRAGGHGGQGVNTTDSAVRITHLPTGLVVAIQNERSQLQNKEKAMAILKSRLTVLMEEQHKEKISELRGTNESAAWGNQIRSYVLHPYTKVKDHRTDFETSDAQAVLDGNLEPFIDARLESLIGPGTSS